MLTEITGACKCCITLSISFCIFLQYESLFVDGDFWDEQMLHHVKYIYMVFLQCESSYAD